MIRNTPLWRWLVVVAVALSAVTTVGLTASTLQMAQAPAAEETAAPAESPAIDDATEVEIQRRFNELRRELLDDRAASISWWLSGVALLLTVLAIVIAAAGYLGLRKFQEIAAEARRNVEKARAHAEQARKFADEIREYGEEVDEHLRGMTSTGSGSAQDKTGEDFARDPGRVGASAIAEARLLAEEGRIDAAIERWQNIAHVAEGTNNDLAALAYRSIGDLSEQRSRRNGP